MKPAFTPSSFVFFKRNQFAYTLVFAVFLILIGNSSFSQEYNRIETFTTANGLASLGASDILIEDDGTVWVTHKDYYQAPFTHSKPISRREAKGTWDYPSLSALPTVVGAGGVRYSPESYQFEKMFKSSNGTIWFMSHIGNNEDGTYTAPLVSYNMGQFQAYHPLLNNFPNKGGVIDMAEDKQGNLWFACSGGLVKMLPNGNFQTFTPPNAQYTASNGNSANVPARRVVSIDIDKDDNVVMVVDGQFSYVRRYRPNDNQWDLWTLMNAPWYNASQTTYSPLEVKALHDNENTIWVTTFGGGLYYIKNNEYDSKERTQVANFLTPPLWGTWGWPMEIIRTNIPNFTTRMFLDKKAGFWVLGTPTSTNVDYAYKYAGKSPTTYGVNQLPATRYQFSNRGSQFYYDNNGTTQRSKITGLSFTDGNSEVWVSSQHGVERWYYEYPYPAATPYIGIEGAGNNHIGIAAFNTYTHNAIEPFDTGHTVPIGIPNISVDSSYYYISSSDYDGLDASVNAGMKGDGEMQGFPALAEALQRHGFTPEDIKIRFTPVSLGDDERGANLDWQFEPSTTVETRRYRKRTEEYGDGSTEVKSHYEILLGGTVLYKGEMPDVHLGIRYNKYGYWFDSIAAHTIDALPVRAQYITQESALEVANAFEEDLRGHGIRFRFQSMQIANDTTIRTADRAGGYFKVHFAYIEKSDTAMKVYTPICPEGNITFNSPESLASFLETYPNCTRFRGNVLINGVQISDLSPLENIKEIDGNLTFNSCVALSDLSPLSQLEKIGGYLQFSYNNNAGMTSLQGLSGLNYIGSNISIYNNNNLVDLRGLENIQNTPQGYIYIGNNPSMMSLSGIQNLDMSSVTELFIQSNANLSLCSFPNICGYLSNDPSTHPRTISGNSEGCAAEEEMCVPDICPEGNQFFYTQEDLDAFRENYPNCTKIEGNLTISAFDLIPLNIIEITGDLTIHNTTVTDLSMLTNLEKIGGNFAFSSNSNPGMVSLNGLSKISYIGRMIYINANEHLVDISALSNVSNAPSGAVYIANNDALVSLSGLQNINMENVSHLYIEGNGALSICSFPNICSYLSDANRGRTVQGNIGECASDVLISADCPGDCTDYTNIDGEIDLPQTTLTATASCVSGDGWFHVVNGDEGALLVSVNPGGNDPVNGSIMAKSWIQATQPAQFVRRHYEISPQNGHSGRVQLYFTQDDFNAFNARSAVKLPEHPTDEAGKANIRIEKRGGVSSDGSGLPNSYSGPIVTIANEDLAIEWNAEASRWEISFDVTSFSGFFLKGQDGILPLRLLSFKVVENQCKMTANWKTAQEENVSHYEIEGSVDGIMFNTLNTIPANNRSTEQNYNLTIQALTGQAFYRLKMVDVDGSYAYSETVYIGSSCQAKITIYPNPVSDYLVIRGAALGSQYTVYDVAGRKIMGGVISQSLTYVNMKNIGTGIYFVVMNGKSFRVVKD